KWPELRRQWPDLRLHLIGPLQTNKTAEAVALFDAIHSIDRPKLASLVAREMKAQNRQLSLFIQVNIGREAQKAGVDPDEADAFIAECREHHGLAIAGLMCIPPAEAEALPFFQELARIAGRNNLPGLSMGMSGDFPAAITAGATHVRVGSAIFGARPAP
ncbi:MAG: YggS family pyridoxal phosphate-dependent enzyme, partial [Alphaproteobacteria bacterium]|nr:YggS family pyridoxal phosphate-dependent enzyme [Alphaproteobacteria bacterium]